MLRDITCRDSTDQDVISAKIVHLEVAKLIRYSLFDNRSNNVLGQVLTSMPSKDLLKRQ